MSKYKVGIAKTKLDSVTFSDIVNYESNDDIVSLTGDSKFRPHNQLSNKLSSNKSSTIGHRPQTAQITLETPKITQEVNYEIDESEIKLMQNVKQLKEQVTFTTNNIRQPNRESDMVKIDDSSVMTSQVTNIGRQRNTEDQKRDSTSNHYPSGKMNQYIPKANINIDAIEKIPEFPNSEVEYQRSIDISNIHQEQDESHINTMLNRISEELGLSGDTHTSRSLKKDRSSSKKSSPAKKSTPAKKETQQNQSRPFQIEESYDDFATFEVPQQQQMDMQTPNKQVKQSPAKKAPKTHRATDKSRDSVKQKKLKEKKKLEQKLKKLEELERIIHQKENSKKTKKRSILVIQRWVRGHLARKHFKAIKRDACYVRKLRRFMSVGIKKMQSKFIKNLIYELQK